MIFTTAQIEAITQDVLRELQSRGVAIAPAPKGTGTGSASTKQASGTSAANDDSSPNGSTATVSLNQSVITEDLLVAADVAGRTIAISGSAVLTPSGRDYIRRHKIRISTSGRETAAVQRTLSLVLVGRCSAAESAASSTKCAIVKAGCDPDAAYQSRKLIPNSVVTCSQQPAVVACLLNRDSAIRAAVVDASVSISELQATMNPQVVCVSPEGWSFADFRRLFRHLASADSAAPTAWKELR